MLWSLLHQPCYQNKLHTTHTWPLVHAPAADPLTKEKALQILCAQQASNIWALAIYILQMLSSAAGMLLLDAEEWKSTWPSLLTFFAPQTWQSSKEVSCSCCLSRSVQETYSKVAKLMNQEECWTLLAVSIRYLPVFTRSKHWLEEVMSHKERTILMFQQTTIQWKVLNPSHFPLLIEMILL